MVYFVGFCLVGMEWVLKRALQAASLMVLLVCLARFANSLPIWKSMGS